MIIHDIKYKLSLILTQQQSINATYALCHVYAKVVKKLNHNEF